jgi:hypothetical protein
MHTGHVENEKKIETNEHLNSVTVRTSRDGKLPPLMMWIHVQNFLQFFFKWRLSPGLCIDKNFLQWPMSYSITQTPDKGVVLVSNPYVKQRR